MSILAATDLSTTSHGALKLAAREAKADGETLVVAHCIRAASDKSRWSYYLERAQGHDEAIRQAALKKVTEVCEEAVPEADRPTHVEYVVRMGHPAETLREIAEEKGARLLVLGGIDERAMGAYFVGGTAEDVIRGSDKPVMVVPSDYKPERIQRVLAPVDFSECSRASLRWAARWARRRAADLVVVHATGAAGVGESLFGWQPDAEEVEAVEAQQRERLESMVDALDVEGVEIEALLRDGAPHRAVAKTVDEKDIDAVVMGTHGQRGWKRFFVGSTALKVLRGLPCPVVTLRHREDGSP